MNVVPVLSDSKPYVCVFAGARDHYQVALALAEAGRLERLINEFYVPALPPVLRRFVEFVDRRGWTDSRSCIGLSGNLVGVPIVAFLAGLLNRSGRSRLLTVVKDRALGRACGRLAAERKLPVLAYSYYASYAFAEMPKESMRVIFQVHPYPATVRRILLDELRLFPLAKESLQAEHELNFSADLLDHLSQESLDAHFALTPSTFARQSLIDAGIPAERIAVIPYGIASDVFAPKLFAKPSPDQPLRLIFVGSMIQRKGLGYLFEAMRRLRGESVELVLVGRSARDTALLAHYRDIPVRIVRNASRSELVHELHDADVFVLPSLAESFAHVILEAMAVGLPVITTTNTAGPDLLEEGRTGFVGPIRDVDFLIGKIRWFLANREAVSVMGRACQEEAAQRTWPRFRREIRTALALFEDRWKNKG